METVNSYRDLKVWQRAMDVAAQVYELTRSFPKDELYGLTSQARRASVSIAANIAEGYGRSTRPSYLHFLRVAQGSLKELETHLLLATRVAVCSDTGAAPILAETDELGRMLRALIVRLEQEPSA